MISGFKFCKQEIRSDCIWSKMDHKHNCREATKIEHNTKDPILEISHLLTKAFTLKELKLSGEEPHKSYRLRKKNTFYICNSTRGL